MRIVGGEFRGRPLATPASLAIRPTSDRVRESLFNILQHGFGDPVTGARVLDLFSGTGALGLEALSRGARFCQFVEDSVEGRGLLRANVEALGLQGRTKLYRRDATRLGPVGTLSPFSLLFADPPYGKGLGEAALASAAEGGWLVPGALAIVEERVDAGLAAPAGFVLEDRRVFGDTAMHMLRFRS